MAPRAIGLGRDADHVHRRHRARQPARRPAPCPTSTSRSRCSRSRSGSSACRSASSCCPTLSREAAVGHEARSRRLLTRALRLLIYVMVPIAVADRGRPPAGRRAPVRGRQDPPGRPRPDRRRRSSAFLVGLDRARADRRPGPGVLRAPGHGHAGRRGGRRGGDQLHARGPAGRAARAARASRWRSRSRPGSRRSRCWRSCYRRLPHFGSRGLGRVGVEALVGSVVAGRRRRAGPRSASAARSAREPGAVVLLDRIGASSASPSGRSTRCCRSPCGSRNCRLSSGSWPTSLRRPSQVVTAVDPTAWDRFVEASDPGSYLQMTALGHGQGRQRLDGPPDRDGAAERRSAPRSSSAGRDRCRGASPTRRADRSPAPGTPDGDRRLHRARPARACRRPPAGSATSGSTPRSRPTGRSTPTARSAGPAAAGWRPAPPIQPNATRIIDLRPDEDALCGDLRKKWRQYVNKARTGGHHGRRCGWRPARRVLPDLPRDRGPGRVPHPRRVGLPRRLGRVRPDGQRPAAVRPDRRRRAAGDAVPRPLRAARRRAVRRDDRGRRRVTRELPAQVGGDPVVARGGRHELRPVGPRDRRDRPLQDRVRRSRGPLHRGLGPRPEPARAAARYDAAPSGARVRLGAARRGGRAAIGGERGGATERPIERPRRDRRPSSPTGTRATVEAPGGHVYQSRAWAEHRQRERLAAALPASRTTAAGRSRSSGRGRSSPGGSAYLPRGPGRAGRRRRGPRRAPDRGRRARLPPTASTSSPPTPRCRPPTPRSATRSRRAGFRADRGDPAVAPPGHRCRSTAADEDGGLRRRSPSRPASGSARPRRRASSWSATTAATGPTGPGRASRRPAEPADAALDRFYDLLLETGERRHFSFGPRAGVRRLVARGARGRPPRLPRGPGGPGRGEPLAGLILYRHGGRLSTVHSGDHAGEPDTHPGALHLLRWRAIELAIREGCTEMDLGGVDVAGARGEPQGGRRRCTACTSTRRRSAARWLELTGAHERVYDARGYRPGRLAGRRGRGRPPMTDDTPSRWTASSPPPSRPNRADSAG